jgi:predicted DNA binding CopG/RHH family protein
MTNAKSESLPVRLPPDVLAFLKDTAKLKGIAVGTLARMVLTSYARKGAAR